VAQAGAPLELYDDPDNTFVAGFIGSPKMNFLPGVVDGTSVHLPEHGNQAIPLPVKVASGRKVTVGIRPEHFKAGGAAHLDLEVEMIEHLGAETYAHARFGKGELLTLATQNDRALQSGAKMTATFDPSLALLFDTDGQRLR
jgi:lactose/L-arabinose transport system ATP-binding protein